MPMLETMVGVYSAAPQEDEKELEVKVANVDELRGVLETLVEMDDGLVDEDIVDENAKMLLENLFDVEIVLLDVMATDELILLLAILEETGALLEVVLEVVLEVDAGLLEGLLDVEVTIILGDMLNNVVKLLAVVDTAGPILLVSELDVAGVLPGKVLLLDSTSLLDITLLLILLLLGNVVVVLDKLLLEDVPLMLLLLYRRW